MKALRFFVVLLLVCSVPFSVFALDMGFAESLWFLDKPYEYKSLELNSAEASCIYYINTEDICFYMHLACDTENLTTDNEVTDIYLHFEINGNSFNIDKNGFRENAVDKAEIHQKFSVVQGGGSDIYIGIDFSKSEYKKTNNTLSVELRVNNDFAYTIIENVPLNFKPKETTASALKPDPTATTKSNTTDQTTSETNTKSPVDKEESTTLPIATENTTNKPATEKATTEPSTKFKYTGTAILPTTTTNKNTENNAQAVASTAAEKSTQGTQSVTTTSTTKFTNSTTGSNTVADKEDDTGNVNYEMSLDGGATQNTIPNTTEADRTENTDIKLPEEQNGSELSPQVKLFIAIAVIFAASGIAITFHALAKKEKDQPEETEENEDNETE